MAMPEKPSSCARIGVSVVVSPLPSSRNAVERRMAQIENSCEPIHTPVSVRKPRTSCPHSAGIITTPAWLERIPRDQKPRHYQKQKCDRHQFQPLFDEFAHRFAQPEEKCCLERETAAARDGAKQDEVRQIETGKTGGDCHQLEGYWRESLEKDHPPQLRECRVKCFQP